MFTGIFDSIFKQLIMLFIFTLVPALIVKFFESRRAKFTKEIIKKYSLEINDTIKSPSCDYLALCSSIDLFREKSINLFKKNKISKKNLLDINDEINNFVDLIRIKYIDDLFKDKPELTEIKKALFSDNKVSQNEIYNLINEVKKAKSLTKEEKDNIIFNINDHCVKDSRRIDNKKLLENIHTNFYTEIKTGLKYALLLLPAILLLAFFIYRSKMNPDMTFGAVIYIDKNTFTETFKQIEEYIANETGKKIDFIYYSFDDIEKMTADMKSGKLKGLILNPGTYAALYETDRNLLDKFEIFLRHLEDGKEKYKSVIITNKNKFITYCNNISKPPSYFESELNDSLKYYLKHYIQSGIFGFVHRYSMSGYNLPKNYLWYEFNLNINEQDTSKNGLLYDFTGDHDKSIMDAYEDKFYCAVTYENRLQNIGSDDIKNNIQILYKSPDIPYNSYLYSRDTDSSFKVAVKNAFLKLNKDESEKALRVKKNKMRITGWVASSDEEYLKLLEPCFNVLNTRLPKPQIVFNNSSSTDSDFKDRLNDIMHILINKMKKMNAWDVRSQGKASANIPAITINLKSYTDVYKEKPVKLISGYIKSGAGDLKNFEINIDDLKGDKDKIIYAIMTNIIDVIEIKSNIKYDYQGLFINLGEDDGIKYNSFILPGGEVIQQDLYSVEKLKTIFKKSDKETIDKYRNKQVTVKYDLDNALKLY